MLDTSPAAVATLPLYRHVAVQRMLGMTEMVKLADAEGRTTPARVYPAAGDAGSWVVEAPSLSEIADDTGVYRTFAGPAALLMALEYAHTAYGSAVFLSR